MKSFLSAIINLILIVFGTCFIMFFTFWGIKSFEHVLDDRANFYDYLGSFLFLILILWAIYWPLKNFINDTFY